ncbi:toxin-antitoxin system, toxin component, PIN family protein [Streptomyces sp. NPDC048254]|uniref:PIN-like domain-containing protein n=1 Tax=Streptomyces sp. NPDC048254 TaxID=3365525 RepID=UPI00371AFE95
MAGQPLDRNLGRRVAEGLRTPGWTVHRIGDEFPDAGQDVPNEEWIAHGLFCLDNQQLHSLEMAERLHTRRDAIHRAVERGGPAAYAVRHDRIKRTWP